MLVLVNRLTVLGNSVSEQVDSVKEQVDSVSEQVYNGVSHLYVEEQKAGEDQLEAGQPATLVPRTAPTGITISKYLLRVKC